MEHLELRQIPLSEKETLKKIAALITQYSWFDEYPVDPLEELEKSEYVLGAYIENNLIGFGTVNRCASPDNTDNGEMWFADAVVLPEYRRQGVYSKLYDARMHFVKDNLGRILSCTENPHTDEFFIKHDWKKIRDTKDEQGNDCRVYEFFRT